MNHLEGVFVGCQEPLVAAPALDEREAARLARRMCQRIDDILKKAKVDRNSSGKIRTLNIFRHNKDEKNFRKKKIKRRDDKLGKLSGRIRHRRPAGYPPPKLSIPWRMVMGCWATDGTGNSNPDSCWKRRAPSWYTHERISSHTQTHRRHTHTHKRGGSRRGEKVILGIRTDEPTIPAHQLPFLFFEKKEEEKTSPFVRSLLPPFKHVKGRWSLFWEMAPLNLSLSHPLPNQLLY